MSFFESMALSGQERIHSQVIAWIFSSECQAFLLADKLKILSSLVGKQVTSTIIKSITEYGDIDILILCDNDAIIIENKIKIQTHSNQLEKYQKVVKESELTKTLNHHFLYLSLFREDIKNSNWKKLLHEDLALFLNNSEKSAGTDKVLLEEYLKFHKKLTNAKNIFFNKVEDFEDVYLHASKDKTSKAIVKYSSPISEFIVKTGLETIFQIAYLQSIAEEVNHREEFSLAESHGMGLINFKIKEIIHDNQKYIVNLQYQGDTIKINFASLDYFSSRKEQLPEMILAFFVDNSATSHWLKYKKFNPPKSKAYISRSRKIGLPCSMSKRELVNLLKEEISFFNDFNISL
jgi:hypothetical protein